MSAISKIEILADEVLERHCCDLVLATLKRESHGLVLRLLIEKKGSDPSSGSGVDHRLCSRVSRDMEAVLETHEILDKAYILEVSSPGIERPLIGAKDFERFTGRRARIRTSVPVEERRKFDGNIVGVENGMIRIELENRQVFSIPIETITKANLVFIESEFETRPGAK